MISPRKFGGPRSRANLNVSSVDVSESSEKQIHEDNNRVQDQPHSWVFEEEEKLVALVAKVPSFYNRKEPGHLNKHLKLKNWDLIGKQMNISGEEVRKRFTHLREHYARYLRARREGFKGKLFWYKKFRLASQMSFLSRHIYSRQKRKSCDYEDMVVNDEIYGDDTEDEFEGEEEGGDIIPESSTDQTSFEDLISFPRQKSECTKSNSCQRICSSIDKRDSGESQVFTTEDGLIEKNIDTSCTPDYQLRIVDPSPSILLIPASTDLVGSAAELLSTMPSKPTVEPNDSHTTTMTSSNDKLLHILERGGPNLESGPNYLFGMYVASKLDKMSPEDASYCTLRIHEVLYRAEIKRHRTSQILSKNNLQR